MIPLTFNALTLLATTLLLHHSTPIHAHPQPTPVIPSQDLAGQQLPRRQFAVPSAPACCTAAVNLIAAGSADPSAVQAQIDDCYRPGGCAYTAFFSLDSSLAPTRTATGYVSTTLPPLATGYYHSNGSTDTGGSDTTGSDTTGGGSGDGGSGDGGVDNSGSGPSDGGNAPSDDGTGTGVSTPSSPYSNGTVVAGGGTNSLNGTSGLMIPSTNQTDAASGKRQSQHHQAATGGEKIKARFVQN